MVSIKSFSVFFFTEFDNVGSGGGGGGGSGDGGGAGPSNPTSQNFDGGASNFGGGLIGHGLIGQMKNFKQTGNCFTCFI